MAAFRLSRMLDSGRKRVIAGAALLICILHYSTPLGEHFLHGLYARLYYLPIFLGGFWFGLWGGLRVSLLVSLIYLPHVYMAWGHDLELFYEKLLEVCLFNVAGPVVGLLADRERRQRARNQELQTLATLGEAVSFVAHEMKNIVIPIRGFIRKLRQTNPDEENAPSYLDIVDRESARLEEMTRDMLAFARHSSLRREEVDLRLFFQELKESLEIPFRDGGVRLRIQWQESAGRVYMDPERVRHALVNLLVNALQASQKGKEVRLVASREGACLRIVVEDEGEGIPKEDLGRIFLPFFTTKSRGTGLGLAIAQRIAQEHGGRLEAHSQPGTGTRFVMEISASVEESAVSVPGT